MTPNPADPRQGAGPGNTLSIVLSQAELRNTAMKVGGNVLSDVLSLGVAYSAARSRVGDAEEGGAGSGGVRGLTNLWFSRSAAASSGGVNTHTRRALGGLFTPHTGSDGGDRGPGTPTTPVFTIASLHGTRASASKGSTRYHITVLDLALLSSPSSPFSLASTLFPAGVTKCRILFRPIQTIHL